MRGLETDREGRKPGLPFLRQQAHDQRTVDAPGQEHAHRHVGHQPPPHGDAQRLQHPVGPVFGGKPGLLAAAVEPCLPVGRVVPAAVGVDPADRRRRQLAHARQDRVRRGHDRMPAHVMVQRHPVDRGIDAARRQQRGQGGGEAQARAVLGVVERLDPETVAHQPQPPAVAFVDREGEHPLQPVHRARPPFGPGLQDHLGIAVRGEAVPLRRQVRPKLGVVVDAAVEGDGQAGVGVGKRLGRGFAQVDDLQPPVAEARAPAQDEAEAIRPARRHRRAHPFDRLGRGRAAVESDLSANAAHRGIGSPSWKCRGGIGRGPWGARGARVHARAAARGTAE